MVDLYFAIDTPSEVFNYCFKNLKIAAKEPRNRYFILKFDFTAVRIASVYCTDELNRSVLFAFHQFFNRYSSIFEFPTLSSNPIEAFRQIICAVRNYGGKIYLLIDEVDCGASAVMVGKYENASIKHITGLIKDSFFSQVITQGLAVGITTLAIDDILSFGIWKDQSFQPQWGTLFGATLSEITETLNKNSEKNHSAFLEYLQKEHNGYCFTIQDSERVLNITGVIQALHYYLNGQTFETCNFAEVFPAHLMALLQRLPEAHELLLCLISDKKCSCPSGNISELFQPLLYGIPSTTLQLKAFFLSLGILSGPVLSGYLYVPNNLVWRVLLQEQGRHLITTSSPSWELERRIVEFCKGNIEPYLEYLERQVFSKTHPVRDSPSVQLGEPVFKAYILSHLVAAADYQLESERTTSNGFIDILLRRKYTSRRMLSCEFYDMLIELKYLHLNKIRSRATCQPITLAELTKMSLSDIRDKVEVCTIDESKQFTWCSWQKFEAMGCDQAMQYREDLLNQYQGDDFRICVVLLICIGMRRIVPKLLWDYPQDAVQAEQIPTTTEKSRTSQIQASFQRKKKKRGHCFSCGQEGHWQEYCPVNRCYFCKQPGHWAKKYPNRK
jgi:hypothetical protein